MALCVIGTYIQVVRENCRPRRG